MNPNRMQPEKSARSNLEPSAKKRMRTASCRVFLWLHRIESCQQEKQAETAPLFSIGALQKSPRQSVATTPAPPQPIMPQVRSRLPQIASTKPTMTFQAHCSCRYYTKASGRPAVFLDNPIIGFEVRICLIHRRVFRLLHLQVLRQSSSSAAVTSRHSPGWSDSSSLRPPTATRLSESTTKCAAEHI